MRNPTPKTDRRLKLFSPLSKSEGRRGFGGGGFEPTGFLEAQGPFLSRIRGGDLAGRGTFFLQSSAWIPHCRPPPSVRRSSPGAAAAARAGDESLPMSKVISGCK